MNINGSDVAVRWPFVVQALPGFLNIPPEERAYQFGSSTPFPARNWKQCTYFWTALARLNPVHRNVGWAGSDWTNGIIPSSSYNYDVYIMVFRKGAVEQSFTTDKLPSGVSELAGTRNTGGAVTYSDTDYVRLIPPVGGASYIPGAYAGGGNWSTVARPALGEMGIGAVSGTVFKQVLSDDFSNAVPRPDLIRDTNKPYPVVEPMFFSPAADNTNASPLIYIYQTTMTF
jgi:hypothetical protein